MKILALELSTARASLAWLTQGEQTEVREWRNDRNDSGLFFDNLDAVIKGFGLPEKIIVGLGPGSYAGVRIAISTAIGLQAAAGGELLGKSSACAISCAGGGYAVVGDARRRTFYFARICDNEVIEGFELDGEEELKSRLDRLDPKIRVFSSDRLPQFERVEKGDPSAEILAGLATRGDRNFCLPPLEPIYLRAPHITMPKPTVPLSRS